MLRMILLLALALPLAAQETPLLFGNWGMAVSVHTAIPVGQLAADVNHQLGFGWGIHLPVQASDRICLRPSFEWTGYRVNDRNWATRVLANLLDANYSEDRIVLRSYKVGLDFLFYEQKGLAGVYGILSGGVQRSRLYLEERNVDQNDSSEQVRPLHSWDGLNTAWFGLGLGYQSRKHFFSEFKYTHWRYLAQPGTRLSETDTWGPLRQREAHSLTLGAGLRF